MTIFSLKSTKKCRLDCVVAFHSIKVSIDDAVSRLLNASLGDLRRSKAAMFWGGVKMLGKEVTQRFPQLLLLMVVMLSLASQSAANKIEDLILKTFCLEQEKHCVP